MFCFFGHQKEVDRISTWAKILGIALSHNTREEEASVLARAQVPFKNKHRDRIDKVVAGRDVKRKPKSRLLCVFLSFSHVDDQET